MTLYHCNQCESVTSQKWPGIQWESTHSCTTVPHTCSFSHKCHSKHKLRRSLSDPGLNFSTTSLELKTLHQKECQPVSNRSIEDEITIEAITPEDDTSLSVHNSTDLLNESQDLEQGQSSGSEEKAEMVWSKIRDKLHDSDSLFGADDVVQFDDYYYEDEENKSKIISFKNCPLRLHGLLVLLLIYAAGYLAYTFLPSSKRKCQRPTPNVTPTNNTLLEKNFGT